LQRFNLPSLALAKTRRKAITLQPIDPSNAVELDLLLALNRIVRAIVGAARADLVPVAAQEAAAFRAKDEAGANARQIIEYLRKQAAQAEAKAQGSSWEAIKREGARHTGKWKAAIASGANVDVAALLRDDDLADLLAIKSEQFNALIRNLSEDMLARIERQTLGSILEGRGNAAIAKDLQEIEGIGRARARLIARDQAAKLNSSMNQFRQEQAGVTHYKWRTILDGRERDTHRANNGKVFAWAKPPPGTGHPGKEINCRCRGLAVLIEAPEDAAEAGLTAKPVSVALDPNEDLIRRVSRTMSEPVLSFTREAALIRQAEAQQLKQLVGAMKAASAVTEADAEALFRKVFGFASEGQDLAKMTGTNGLFAKRRTQLFGAVQSRLNTIEELLEHVASTASAGGVLNTELVLPKLTAPAAIKGIKLDPLPAPANGIANAEAAAKKWLSQSVKNADVEYVISHDDAGNFIAAHTNGKKYAVTVPAKLAKMKGQAGLGNVHLHHNHATDTSFSKADFKAAGGFYIKSLSAHTPDGSTFKIQGGVLHFYKAEKAFDVIVKVVKKLVKTGVIEQAEAAFVATHAASLGAQRAGATYLFNLSPKLKKIAAKHAKTIKTLAENVEAQPAPTTYEPPVPADAPAWYRALPANGEKLDDKAGRARQKASLDAVKQDELQREWVKAYTGHRYEAINDTLRGKRAALTPADLKEASSSIDAATAAKLPNNYLLYRGLGLPDNVAKKLKVGSVFSDAGFTSTTIDRDLARGWAARAPDKRHVFVIESKDLSGLDVRDISYNASEQEIILQRNQKLEVTRIEEYSGLRYVFLKAAKQ